MDSYGSLAGPSWNGVPYAPQSIATSVLGPVTIGIGLKVLLAGLALGNFSQYLGSANYASDRRAHKIILWFVMVELLLFTALDSYLCVQFGVRQDRTIPGVLYTSVGHAIGPVLVVFQSASMQTVLLIRASQLLRDRRRMRVAFLVTGFFFILLTIVASIGQSVATFALSFGFTLKFVTIDNAAATYLWLSATLDCSVALALILSLKKHVRGFNPQTDRALRHLMRSAATTASCTAACATTAASLSVAWPAHTDHFTTFLALSIPLGSMYALSLLATLSARKSIARGNVVAKTGATVATSESRVGGASGAGTRGAGAVGRTLSRLGSVRSQRSGYGGPSGCAVEVSMEVVEVVEDGTDASWDNGRARRTRGAQLRAVAGSSGAPLPPPKAPGLVRASGTLLDVPRPT